MNNKDIYDYLTGILRKSTRGNALSPSIFTRYLQQANWEFFNQELPKFQESQRITETFKPLLASGSVMVIGSVATLPSDYHTMLPETLMYSTTPIDLITLSEYNTRVSDTLTAPSVTHPIAWIEDASTVAFNGVASGTVTFMYIKSPGDPYFDYYTDTNLDIQYLTEGQSAYTLQGGEVYRDGTSSGSVTSISKELDWNDNDKVKVANIILGYMGVQIEDQGAYQQSGLQEQKDEMLR